MHVYSQSTIKLYNYIHKYSPITLTALVDDSFSDVFTITISLPDIQPSSETLPHTISPLFQPPTNQTGVVLGAGLYAGIIVGVMCLVFVLVAIILGVVTVRQHKNKDYRKWSRNYNSELGTLIIGRVISL